MELQTRTQASPCGHAHLATAAPASPPPAKSQQFAFFVTFPKQGKGSKTVSNRTSLTEDAEERERESSCCEFAGGSQGFSLTKRCFLIP